MSAKGAIYVVIHDAGLRRHIVSVLRSQNYKSTPFSSGADFLNSAHFLEPGVAIIDLHLPDMHGLDLLGDVLSRRVDIPIVMSSDGADIRTAVQAIKKGAQDFLERPFVDDALSDRVESAASFLDGKVEQQKMRSRSKECVRCFTQREIQVIKEIDKFDNNCVVAEHLNLSIRSVETYRSRIMKKCGATRFSEVLAICREAERGLPLDRG